MTHAERARELRAVIESLAETLGQFSVMRHLGGPHGDVGGGSGSPLFVALEKFVVVAETPWSAGPRGLGDNLVPAVDLCCRDLALVGRRILDQVCECEAEGRST